MKRVKYLNNRDLLAQIHTSKNTYCSYVLPEDARYDLIVTDLKKINANAIAMARKARSKRLTQEAWEQAKKAGLKKLSYGYESFSSGKERKIISIHNKIININFLPLICYEIIY